MQNLEWRNLKGFVLFLWSLSFPALMSCAFLPINSDIASKLIKLASSTKMEAKSLKIINLLGPRLH